MNVARLLYPVRTLGPGNRLGIWLCGCPRRCKGCSNPELWREKDEYSISVDHLMRVILDLASKHKIDGFTITGGEPLEQAGELLSLLDQLQTISMDILIYTGYTLEELSADPAGTRMDCVRKAAVIVDGPYMEEQNGGSRLVGSFNQRVILINRDFEDLYRSFLNSKDLEVQNFIGNNSAYSIGIHRKDFANGMFSFLNGKECDPS